MSILHVFFLDFILEECSTIVKIKIFKLSFFSSCSNIPYLFCLESLQNISEGFRSQKHCSEHFQPPQISIDSWPFGERISVNCCGSYFCISSCMFLMLKFDKIANTIFLDLQPFNIYLVHMFPFLVAWTQHILLNSIELWEDQWYLKYTKRKKKTDQTEVVLHNSLLRGKQSTAKLKSISWF